jgi:hypothetical protein
MALVTKNKTAMALENMIVMCYEQLVKEIQTVSTQWKSLTREEDGIFTT